MSTMKQYVVELSDKDKACREKKRLYAIEYRKKNPDKCREYYLKNKTRLDAINKKNREANREHVNKRQREYIKNRRLNNDSLRLLYNLRTRVRSAIRRNTKGGSTISLLGCTIKELKKHLESMFDDNMSWDNYGLYGWHIDHIKPCASFDLSIEDEQRKCFHYTNLQPLWAKDNLKKKDKIL